MIGEDKGFDAKRSDEELFDAESLEEELLENEGLDDGVDEMLNVALDDNLGKYGRHSNFPF